MGRIELKNTAGTGNPRISAEGGADTGITFDNDQNEEILIIDSVATSVNQLTIASAATGNNPSIVATGDDNTVGIAITGKAGGAATAAGGALVLAGGAGNTTGAGGAVSKTGGAGGNSTGGSTGGAGGAASLVSGAGGTEDTGTGGAGGAVAVTGAAGGATSGAGGTGGAGASISITAGAGGADSEGGSGTGGAGGSVTVTAGAGGAGNTAGAAGVITLASRTTASVGVQYTAYAATATADGLTTGLIPAGYTFISVTSASANNIVTLPAGTAGQIIYVYVGANGCEMRTPASSNATINNVDSDGTNELALGATTSYICICVATDTWIVRGFTNLGADQAALVPDAA